MKKIRKKEKLVNSIVIAFIIIMLMSQVCFALDTSRYSEIYKTPTGADTLLNKGRKDIRCSTSSRY